MEMIKCTNIRYRQIYPYNSYLIYIYIYNTLRSVSILRNLSMFLNDKPTAAPIDVKLDGWTVYIFVLI